MLFVSLFAYSFRLIHLGLAAYSFGICVFVSYSFIRCSACIRSSLAQLSLWSKRSVLPPCKSTDFVLVSGMCSHNTKRFEYTNAMHLMVAAVQFCEVNRTYSLVHIEQRREGRKKRNVLFRLSWSGK